MTVWRIEPKVVDLKSGNSTVLPTFYIECDSSDVEAQAMGIVGIKVGQRVNLTFGPLENPRKSTANRYPIEGVWLSALNTNDIFVYSEEKKNA